MKIQSKIQDFGPKMIIGGLIGFLVYEFADVHSFVVLLLCYAAIITGVVATIKSQYS